MFRTVELPKGITGKLFLHGTPGRYEPYTLTEKEILERTINRVVCLAPMEEIYKESPKYARILEEGKFPCTHERFDIPDYQVPEDRDGFLKLAHSVATRLRAGEHILIHCGAGIGRTGTLAICVLIVLGMSKQRARDTVKKAGSWPERPVQDELIQWVAEQYKE